MSTPSDAHFAGPLADCYERHLVPLLFAPYARELASRAAALAPGRVLEIAAGTGVVTGLLAASLPAARIVATDLNPDMLALARRGITSSNVAWQAADAMRLPFADGCFDLVLCQFGAMFFPDKRQAFAEARRVLRPGGVFLFNVWDALDANEFARLVQDAVGTLFPADPPSFFGRTPHGYHDKALIAQDLAAAGFVAAPSIDTVTLQGHAPDALSAALGFCQGTPLRAEIAARGGDLDAVTSHVEAHLERRFGRGPIAAAMRAHLISLTA